MKYGVREGVAIMAIKQARQGKPGSEQHMGVDVGAQASGRQQEGQLGHEQNRPSEKSAPGHAGDETAEASDRNTGTS